MELQNLSLTWQVKAAARFIADNKQVLLEMAQRPPKLFQEWLSEFIEQPASQYSSFKFSLLYNQQLGIVSNAYDLLAAYRYTRIAAALETYQRDTGAYPNALTDLVPAYLDEIPRNPYLIDEEEWIYRVEDDGGYIVAMPAQLLPRYDYDDREHILMGPAKP